MREGPFWVMVSINIKFNKLFIVLQIVFSVVLMPSFATAESRGGNEARLLQISSDEPYYCLSFWMDVLEDPVGNLSVDDIYHSESGYHFETNISDTLNFGVTSSVFWLKFRIGAFAPHESDNASIRILDLGEAFPGRLNWSLYDGSENKLLASGGSRSDNRQIVRLHIEPRPKIFFLRVESETGLIMRPRLFTEDAYFNHVRLTTLWLGVFYGIIIAAAAYNFLLFFSFNDNSYFWYVVHLIFVIFYFLGINGISGAYLLPGRPELLGMLNRFFLVLMMASVALLTRSFLTGHLKTQKSDYVIKVLFIFTFAITVINFVAPARFVNSLFVAIGISMPIMMIIASWRALRKGFRPARTFMIAWGLFFVGVIVFSLTVGGGIHFTSLGFYGFQIGSALAAILLSIALGERIRTLRKERRSFKQSTERVSRILDSIGSGIFLIESKSQKIKEANLAAEKMIGKQRKKIIGKYCWDFIRNAGSEANLSEDLCEPGDCRESQLINVAGEEIPVLKCAKTIELDGRCLILESFVDISDLKNAEASVHRSEAKFRSLFESSRDAVMILDQDGWFVDCNKAALEMFGYRSAEELLGHHPSDISPSAQPSGAESLLLAINYMQEALDKGSCYFEWTHKRLNGEEFPAEIMLSKVEVEGKEMLQALLRDITQRKALEDELKLLASTDPLTGANNRRSFLKRGQYELLRSKRYNYAFSVIIMDIDHFKAVNDTFGHHMGDKVLQSLISHSNNTLRETDMLGRLGGEEFAAILPETDIESAVEVGDRLRQAFQKIRIQSDKGPIRFTVSFGVAMLEKEADTLTTIMNRADAALYKAKETGRNRIVVG